MPGRWYLACPGCWGLGCSCFGWSLGFAKLIAAWITIGLGGSAWRDFAPSLAIAMAGFWRGVSARGGAGFRRDLT